MKKPVEIWHLVLTTGMFFIAAGTLVVNQTNRIAKDETEIIHLQEDKKELRDQFHELNNNLIQIRILLEDKQDRQK